MGWAGPMPTGHGCSSEHPPGVGDFTGLDTALGLDRSGHSRERSPASHTSGELESALHGLDVPRGSCPAPARRADRVGLQAHSNGLIWA